MNTATKLGVFGACLVAVFVVALGIGRWAGPISAPSAADVPEHGSDEKGHGHGETDPESQGGDASRSEGQEKAHGGEGHENGHGGDSHEGGSSKVPGGLQTAERGYRFVPVQRTVEPGARTDFRFAIVGPDGRPVTSFESLHEKRLHLIVARRDLSGFRHVHPEMADDGTWSIPLTLPDAGAYRVFADFQPKGTDEPLTLGVDVFAKGQFAPVPLPEPTERTTVDGFDVEIDGALTPGKTSKLTLTITRDGEPVTDLEPYLGAYGHLVALRQGDLAYLHVHPDGEPGDGRTKPGPKVTFFAEVPSHGAYRLYLDFQHGGKVRTAEFTMTTSDAEHGKEVHDDGHGH